jgi:hypothetical protein
MKTLSKQLILAVAVLCLSLGLHAQATLPSTTLSVALTGSPSSATPGNQVDVITLASCSSLVQNSVGQWQTLLYVDTEAMDVVTEITSSPCQLRVVRGAWGTRAELHNSSAVVYVGPPSWFGGQANAGSIGTSDPSGACIAANIAALPYINVNSGAIFTCTGSQWIKVQTGTMGPTASTQLLSQFCTGVVDQTALTDFLTDGVACTGNTTAALAGHIVVSSSGTLYNLQVASTANAAGTSAKEVATVLKNGSATTLTCAMGSGKVCSDLTHSVAVAAGDLITFQFLAGTTDTAANITMSVEKQ